MLRLTKTGVGLLTRLYRSVLHKCFLINVGLWGWVMNVAGGTVDAIKNMANTFGEMANVPLALLKRGFDGTFSIFGSKLENVMDDSRRKRTFTKVLTSSTALVTALGMMISEAIAASAHNVPSGTTVDSIIDTYADHSETNQDGMYIYNAGNINFVQGTVTGNTHTVTVGNYVSALINNRTGGYIGTITGKFANNTINSSYGGGGDDGIIIANYGVIDTLDALIENNQITSDATNGDVTGAVFLNNSTINHIYGSFINNSGTETKGNAISGALLLYAGSKIGDINATFSGNHIIAENTTSAKGGAIHLTNTGTNTIDSISGTFTNNYAQSAGGAAGGALVNEGTISEIVNATFTGNYVKGNSSSHGGAIFTSNRLSIKANDGGLTRFSGNYVNTEDNNEAIYMAASTRTLTLSAAEKGTIIMDDKINGASGYRLVITGDDTGKIQLNDSILGSANITIKGGVDVELGKDNVLNNNNVILSNAYVDMRNDLIGLMSLTRLERTDGVTSNIGIDVSLGSGTADRITASEHVGTGNIIIDAINLPNTKYSDSGASVSVNVTPDSGLRNYLQLSDDIMANISGNNYYTDVQYDPETGNIIFSDKLINQSSLNTELNNYYTKYDILGKEEMSSLEVCGVGEIKTNCHPSKCAVRHFVKGSHLCEAQILCESEAVPTHRKVRYLDARTRSAVRGMTIIAANDNLNIMEDYNEAI